MKRKSQASPMQEPPTSGFHARRLTIYDWQYRQKQKPPMHYRCITTVRNQPISPELNRTQKRT